LEPHDRPRDGVLRPGRGRARDARGGDEARREGAHHHARPAHGCAARALWGRVLAGGAEMYEFQPTMYHCKVLIVDGLWTSVGSTNFDPRSFHLNDEANLNVYDREFARRQTADFEADLKRSRRITYEQWSARPWHEKAWEHFAALFSAQL